jgi:hypothetical protein
MALQNGSVSPEEYQMLLTGGKKMGFDSPDIKLIVNATRKQLYEEAKATLQQVKAVQN